MPSINEHIFDHANAEVKRLRARNAELLEALHVIVKASDLEVAQSIAASAIAIAIVKEK
jgi:hypothetical protein